jgi:hypothetical protein
LPSDGTEGIKSFWVPFRRGAFAGAFKKGTACLRFSSSSIDLSTKKLLPIEPSVAANARQMDKSFFGSFFSKKELLASLIY